MKIFLSYCRENEATANLLAYILELKGINCLYDRRLHPALSFDNEIKKMISSANIIIVLLTKESSNSAWVNQEIGFAIAKNKLIWPIALEKDIQPEGMIRSTQFYSLFDWSNPGRTVEGLIDALKNPSFVTGDLSLNLESQEIFRRQLHRVISGKKERTKFIISSLKELLKVNDNIQIYSQAAFSTFGISNDPDYPVPGIHDKEYLELCLQEKLLFDQLVRKKNVKIKLILYPFRVYGKRHIEARFRSLISWLKETKDITNIDYVISKYHGPNRWIVENYFCLEGYKTHNEPGYEMNVIKFNPEDFLDTLNDFKYAYDNAKDLFSTKQNVIDNIVEMQNKIINDN